MAYTTGNTERDALLEDAIKRVIAVGKTPVLKFVARLLPEDFSADQQELDGMLSEILPDPDKPPSEVERPEPIIAPEHEIAMDEIADAIGLPDAKDDTLNEAQARAVYDHAHKRLDYAKSGMAVAQETLKQLRGGLAAEISSWQIMFRPQSQTREQLQRETIAANQKYKQDVKDGLVPPPVRGPSGKGKSYIDRSSGRGGDGNDFVRRYQGQSASIGDAKVYKGARRDGMPSQYQGRTIKVPSER